MAASRMGEAQPDEERAEFRLLLLQALDDDEARSRALRALGERVLLAATWPGSAEAVRTLTNSDGEQAMPLFTGEDALEVAARRFGWLNPDGSISRRELQARDALRSALEQGVHFVVLDLGAEHSTELTQREVEAVLAVPEPAPAPALPMRAPSGSLTSARASIPLLAEIDEPFASERQSSPERPSVPVAVEEVVARPRVGRDPRAEPDSPPARAALGAVALAQRGSIPKRGVGSKRGTTDFGPPSSDLVPELDAPRAPARADEAPQLEAVPAAPAAVAAPELPPLEPMHAVPAAAPVAVGFDDLPPLAAVEHAGFPMASDPEPEARPAALEAAVLVTQVAKMAKDEATQQAAAEVAEMLKDMARKGGVDESAQEERENAVKTVANLLGAELEASSKRGRAGARAKTEVAPAAESAPQAAEEAASPDKGKPAPRKFHALETPLADALLSAIADALRKYPEVEWACEVGNGSPLPLIGVRVDPGFLTRVSEIEASVLAIASAQKTDVSVLLLSDAQQMREARSAGTVFFPWRKRAKR